jgi:hypothetical protein
MSIEYKPQNIGCSANNRAEGACPLNFAFKNLFIMLPLDNTLFPFLKKWRGIAFEDSLRL